MALIPHSVSVRFSALMGGFTGPLAAAGGAVNRFGRTIDDSTGRQRQAFQRVGRATTIAGLAMVGGFALAVKAAADFDKSMSKVAAVSNATGKQLGALRKAAIDAGRDTQFSATQAADAESELAKAGISVADILGGALRGSLALASAGEVSVADAAVVAAQAMNIFSLKGKDVTHVADVLAAGANKSAGDVKGLAWSMKMGGQVAAQMGLSFESTIGVFSAFADNALIGSDAGTSLKTMLQRLSNPTHKMRDEMEELGIHVYDVNGQFVGMENFAGQLQVALGGLTQEQRDQAIAMLGGADAARGLNILYKIGANGVKQYTDAVNDNGAAQRTAAKLMDNLSGDVEKLKGSLETALIQSGSSANGVLRQMVQALDLVAHGFLALPGSIQSTTVVIIGVTGAVILLAKGMIFMVTTTKDARIALVALGVTGPRVAAAMAAVRGALAATATFMTGPWGVAIGAAIAVLGIFLVTKKGATKATEEFTSAIRADSGALGENTRIATANKLQQQGLTEIARQAGIALSRLTDAVLGDTEARKEVVKVIDDQIRVLQSKKAHDNDEAIQIVGQIGNLEKLKTGIGGVSDEVKASSQAYKDQSAAAAGSTTETKNMTAAQVAAAAKTDDNVSAEQKLVDVMRSATSTAKQLKDAFDELSGANIATAEAEIQQRETLKTASDASDHHRGLVDKEKTALINIAKANQDVLVSMKGSNVEGDKMIAKQHEMTNAFIKTAIGMGATRKEATDMARSFGLFIKVAEASNATIDVWITKVSNAAGAARHLAQRTGGDAKSAQDAFRASIQRSLPVLYAIAGGNARLRGQVDALARSAGIVTGKMNVSRSAFLSAASSMSIGTREAGRLWAKLQALKSKSISVKVDAKGEWEVGGSPASRRSSFATGGPVPMVNGGSRAFDSVPAMLRVDEHVLTPEEVDAMGGHAAVYRLRRAALNGRVQGFANGGRVASANLNSPGSADRVMAPISSGYQAMLRMMVETMAKEIKKALSGGGIVAAARSQIGRPYSWGGGGTGGPSYGIGRGAGTYGFDCSGLTEFAWWKGRKIDIGGTTGPQAAGSHAISGPRPGALGFVGNPIHHVMLGSDRPGYVIQAPFTGSFVQEVQRSSSNWRWPNAAGKARGGAVTRAQREAGRRYITSGGGNDDAALYGLAGDPGSVRGYAGGGWLVGPPGTDKVLLRGTAGEFVVSPGPAKANHDLLEALNVGHLVSAKLVPNIVTSGPLAEEVKTTTVSGPTKLKLGGDFSNPKPKEMGSLLTELGVGKTIKPKATTGSGAISDGSGTVDFAGFNAALSAASSAANSFAASLRKDQQWTAAFSTSMVNAVRRIDAFSGGGGGGTVYQITIDNHGVIGSRTETDKWLRASLERLRREGKIPK